jgi:hypothetical protein
MADSPDWHPGHQLQLWGVEGAQARAAASGTTDSERKRLKERLDVAHGVLSALPSAEDLSFLHSGLCQIGLPHSRLPSNQTIWARRSGRLSLLIKPGVYDNRTSTSRGARPTPEEQEAMFVGLPYGARARLILIFLQGEAVARGREVALGESLSAWMRSLGITPSSGPRGGVGARRRVNHSGGLAWAAVSGDANGNRLRNADHAVEHLDRDGGLALLRG